MTGLVIVLLLLLYCRDINSNTVTRMTNKQSFVHQPLHTYLILQVKQMCTYMQITVEARTKIAMFSSTCCGG